MRPSPTRISSPVAVRELNAVETAEALTLTIAQKLETPNRDRGAHWSKRHRETTDWEILITGALMRIPGARQRWSVIVASETRLDRQTRTWRTHQERRHVVRRVEVTRLVGSAREFIRDADNRSYSLKPVRDALKRLGLLYDDADRWCDCPPPREDVSPDGRAWTVIRIARVG